MVASTRAPAPELTDEQQAFLFMLNFEDDTEEAPWMTMGDLQFWSASSLAHSLRTYAHQHGKQWYVASMLPIRYRWPKLSRKKQVSPDLFVAFVPEHARPSYDRDAEGSFPPFVLEVISPSSVERDEEEKLTAYDLLGVQEYLLFRPEVEGEGESTLFGYRRDAAGAFVPWEKDEAGRLWSAVLDLYFVARGALLRAQTASDEWLLTPEEEHVQRTAAQTARALAEAKAAASEAEVQRLALELERLRSRRDRP